MQILKAVEPDETYLMNSEQSALLSRSPFVFFPGSSKGGGVKGKFSLQTKKKLLFRNALWMQHLVEAGIWLAQKMGSALT